MPLSVSFTRPTGISTQLATLNLKVDRITYAINRLPSQLSLPGHSSGAAPVLGRPRTTIIDLGVAQEIFTLEGVVDLSDDETNNIPGMATLADAIMQWWTVMNTDIGAANSNLRFITMTISLQGISSLTYYGTFKSANFVITGGQDDRWIFNIQFVRRRQVDADL